MYSHRIIVGSVVGLITLCCICCCWCCRGSNTQYTTLVNQAPPVTQSSTVVLSQQAPGQSVPPAYTSVVVADK